tara:strand:- start:968 stop:2203 length:1236 start_codon:yes stop_codon:yes gene_type:complete
MFNFLFSSIYNILLKCISALSVFRFIYPKKYKEWFLEQEKVFVRLKKNKQPSIWIHCSSLGEYEYIKPIIPHLKKLNTNINITFFSISGYTNFKDFELVHQISCLPLDVKFNIQRFISIINPNMVLVSNNDIWPNMITHINNNKIPLYLIGLKLNHQKIKNWWRREYYSQYLSKFNFIFSQNRITSEFLNSRKITNTIIGDLRTKQVLIDSELDFNDIKIQSFIGNNKVIIYGSVENNDYTIINETINTKNDIKHIIVPHKISSGIINKLKNQISSKTLIYSEIENIKTIYNHNILIVDVFGILKHLYRYSHIAYIGGGFNEGVHNTLEPAIHGNFMLFGPKHTHFEETLFFIKKQIAFMINNKVDFQNKINECLMNQIEKTTIRDKILSCFTTNSNNIKTILEHITKNNS